jgi:hypothetical protein
MHTTSNYTFKVLLPQERVEACKGIPVAVAYLTFTLFALLHLEYTFLPFLAEKVRILT